MNSLFDVTNERARDWMAWLNAHSGGWLRVHDHVRFLRKTVNAAQVGLSGRSWEKYAGLDPWADRLLCLVTAMEAGLIRIRLRGDDLVFDFTVRNKIAVPAIRQFLHEYGRCVGSGSRPNRFQRASGGGDPDSSGFPRFKLLLRNLDSWMGAWVDPDDLETASHRGHDPFQGRFLPLPRTGETDWLRIHLDHLRGRQPAFRRKGKGGQIREIPVEFTPELRALFRNFHAIAGARERINADPKLFFCPINGAGIEWRCPVFGVSTGRVLPLGILLRLWSSNQALSTCPECGGDVPVFRVVGMLSGAVGWGFCRACRGQFRMFLDCAFVKAIRPTADLLEQFPNETVTEIAKDDFEFSWSSGLKPVRRQCTVTQSTHQPLDIFSVVRLLKSGN